MVYKNNKELLRIPLIKWWTWCEWRSVGGHHLRTQLMVGLSTNQILSHPYISFTFCPSRYYFFSLFNGVFFVPAVHTHHCDLSTEQKAKKNQITLSNVSASQQQEPHWNTSRVSRQELCRNNGMCCIKVSLQIHCQVDECVRCGGRNACIWIYMRVKETKNKEKTGLKNRNVAFGTKAASSWERFQIGLSGWNIFELSAQKLSLRRGARVN